MELTQQDYEDRKARIADGTADDEDRRLVKHYEREGFESKPADGSWLRDLAGKREGTEQLTDDYDSRDYPALQSLARERSIDANGKKKDLVERLREFDAVKQSER